MAQNINHKLTSEVRIRFWAPEELKDALQELANDRNISLSALLRLIATAYVKRQESP